MSKKEKVSTVEKLARIKLGCITILSILALIFLILSILAFFKGQKDMEYYYNLYPDLTQSTASEN